MFELFRKKNQEILQFDDDLAAFEHACGVGYEPLIGGLVPALVTEEGGLGPDGEKTYAVKLAGNRGAIELWSCTLKGSKGFPQVGDFVGFRVVTIASDLPEDFNLIGYIACKLQPVLVVGRGWRIAQSYTPDNLKPELHM
jgi:hypothetical protein